ncbi:hypothetical protein GTO87_02990 [Ligilactobacillus saerimneri]|uniref:HK97 gp10 family phage protein n=1 Tax=Ligilactobacillus saerimneri TaxID=228229 RepID=A0A7H9EJ36_9LACO|nr:hypothetical protein [Ligilactobacillus saerimneri]QLL77654.1 hypothetical protein GTO87_02990 [Ligilactobacillus saerimneri]
MSKVTGVTEVIANLEHKFSRGKLTRIEKQALKRGGNYIKVNLRHNVVPFRDTGATMREVMYSTPRNRYGEVSLRVGWKSDGTWQRWRLIHLNEFGYTRNGKTISPRGKGTVQRTYDSTRDHAKELIYNELKKVLH